MEFTQDRLIGFVNAGKSHEGIVFLLVRVEGYGGALFG